MDQARQRIALMDVLDRVLDKGIVIDAGIRVAVIGIDVVTVDANITVASIETYMQLAEDQRAYDLGLIRRSLRRSTEEELERRTDPDRLVAGAEEMGTAHSPTAEAAPPPDVGLPIVAYREEDVTTDGSEETEPPERT